MFKRKDKPQFINDNNPLDKISSAPEVSRNNPGVSYLGDEVEITVKPPLQSLSEEHPIAMIPETCIIKGELNCTSDIHINGRVDGVIRSDKSVHILKSGQVEGDIFASSIAVDGVLQGNCIGSDVSINANGTVIGRVQSDALSIDKKGRFHGQSLPRDEIVSDLNNLTSVS